MLSQKTLDGFICFSSTVYEHEEIFQSIVPSLEGGPTALERAQDP